MTADEIGAFREAWGNDGFGADRTYFTQLLGLVGKGPVLECGTGATTLLRHIMGNRRCFKTYCLEQDEKYGNTTARLVGESTTVEIINAPLKDFGKYKWYDAPSNLPPHFSLVVCDGPFIDIALGEPFYSAWRYGVLPWFTATRRTFDNMLLDDVNDPRARPILDRWVREFSVSVQVIAAGDGECAIIRTPQQ